MKKVSILMIIVSFLAGAFLSVLDPVEMNWHYMIPVLALGVIGLWWYRKAHHSEARSGDKLSGNMSILSDSLDRILANLEVINAGKSELPTYQARFDIDRLFRDDLNDFAEARESMIHVFGMQNYADVMSNFAAGERYINRVWSASTDGYKDEVNLYLGHAYRQFGEAHKHFNELKVEFDSGSPVHQGA